VRLGRAGQGVERQGRRLQYDIGQPRGEGESRCFSTSGTNLTRVQIWALAIGKEEKVVVSGGADSVITFWEDVTVTEELERIANHEALVIKSVPSLLPLSSLTDSIAPVQRTRL
jgi:hypothetical protein